MTIKTTKSAKAIIEKYQDIIPETYRNLLNQVISGERALADIPFQEIQKWDKELASKANK
jgi:hypothetical protein